MAMDDAALLHRYVDAAADGVRLHYVEAGTGPLIVLLHGFPDHWYSYRHQLPALAAAGFRVFAPDLRGYNLSDKPRGVRAYGVDKLAGDLASLIRAAGVERAHVVGHDWGSGVAWGFAMAYPAMLDRLALLNGPHPLRLLRALRTPRQLAKSWYMLFFQLPWLPEQLLRAGDFAMIRRSLTRDILRPGAFEAEDIERHVAALREPGAVTAAINYYRAALRVKPPRLAKVEAPVLSIWGEQDRFLGRDLAEPGAALAPNARVERIADAGHWPQHDRPERVNELLVEFFS